MSFVSSRESERFSESVLTERSMMMPYRDGEVDWDTLGNILCSKLMGEVLLASYLDAKHHQTTVDFAVDTAWEYGYEEKDVVVLRKQNAVNPHYVCYMGRGVIDLPLEEIAEFMALPEAPVLYDHHIVDSSHIEIVSQRENCTNVVVYYQAEAKWCLVKTVRDFLFLSSRKRMSGKFMMASMSVDHPLCPPVDGIKRVQLQPGSGWLLEPYQGDSARTLVSYSVHADLIGMPPIIANRALRRQPLNIYYLKRHLLEKKKLCAIPLAPAVLQPVDHRAEPLDISHSGRHFEQPLPINSFTSSNISTAVAGQHTEEQAPSSSGNESSFLAIKSGEATCSLAPTSPAVRKQEEGEAEMEADIKEEGSDSNGSQSNTPSKYLSADSETSHN